MGGSGSQYLGFILGGLPLIIFRNSPEKALIAVFMYAPFVMDVVLGLLRKLYRGMPLHHAHKTHFYQLLHQCGWSHGSVSLLYTALSAISGCAGLAMAHVSPGDAGLIGGILVCGFGLFGVWVIMYHKEKHPHGV